MAQAAVTITPGAAKAEIRRRAELRLADDLLVVDYYRIRRRVAYPLPVRRFERLALPLRFDGGSRDYPWATWMTWELEERLGCLGWAGDAGHRRARAATAVEIDALAAWPEWRQYGKPDLSLGHCARMLVLAATEWAWLPRAVKSRLRAALIRLVDDAAPEAEKYYAPWPTVESITTNRDPILAVHNIPLIGTIGAALAARVVAHAATDALDRRVAIVATALLDLQARGVSEGSSYDGYVLDFLATWLASAPPALRAPIVAHPAFTRAFEQSYRLAAPGDALTTVEFGDVEPVQMRFHVSAHARCLRLRDDPRVRWWLARCPVERLSAATLAELARRPLRPAEAPAVGALDAHEALVLRRGWEAGDLAVAMSCTLSPMHHQHHDDGAIAIGAEGRWLITDPGYQQYLSTSEREFTLGRDAHDIPVIGGHAQTAKACRRLALGAQRDGNLQATLDLTACYPAECGATRVTRTAWLAGADLVVVADRIVGDGVGDVRYRWLGHAAAAWWFADGEAFVSADRTRLRIVAPGSALDSAMVDRPRGSRGQLALSLRIERGAGVHWWVFARGRREPISRSGDTLVVGKRRFTAP